MSPQRLAYFIFLLGLLCSPAVPGQRLKMDSLRKVLAASGNDTVRTSTLNNITRVYLFRAQYDSALQLAEQTLALCNAINDYRGSGNAWQNIGNVHWRRANHPEALHAHFESLRIREGLKNELEVSSSYVNIGLVYVDQQDYGKALDYYYRAKKIVEKYDQKERIAVVYGNIGIVYGEQAGLTSDTTQKTELYKKALEYDFIALKIARELNDRTGISRYLGNIGTIYDALGRNDDALHYYTEALQANEAIKRKSGIAITTGNLGMLFMKKKEYALAREYILKSLALSKEINLLDLAGRQLAGLSTLDSIEGDFKSALVHYREFIAVRDSMNNEENTRKQTQVEMNYEFEKKTAAANAEQEKKDAVTRIIIWSISAGLVLVLLLAIFIFSGYRQKRRDNFIIMQQKAEVERQKLLVESKQEEIIDSLYYARRIQQSLLPSQKYIERKLNQIRNL